MKVFECSHCGQPLYFENARCESCGRTLGYVPERELLAALRPRGEAWLVDEVTGTFRLCANAQYGVCNWLVPAGGPAFCLACRHNRTIPDLTQPDALALWRKLEIAKHRLIYTLLKLHFPLATRAEDPKGLMFDFLAPEANPHVVTGHAGGLITINLAEADDSKREWQRNKMGEPYRTLLGHFRHEIAHYMWEHMVANGPRLAEFRRIFGDEREDYGAALSRYYAGGPPADWPERFVTAYAGSHPWEDFAETWAHYLHMVDTLETASAFGLGVKPTVGGGALKTVIDFDPHRAELDKLISAWLPLTFAVNSINRSMGMPDIYPFDLTPTVIFKLAFVHRTIHAESEADSAPTLRAVSAALTRRVGATDGGRGRGAG
jgi:hypothetical protein